MRQFCSVLNNNLMIQIKLLFLMALVIQPIVNAESTPTTVEEILNSEQAQQPIVVNLATVTEQSIIPKIEEIAKEVLSPTVKQNTTQLLIPSIASRDKLLLEDVIKVVDAYHPKIIGSDLERRIAKAKFLEKQGAFDPFIEGQTQFLRYNDFSKRGKESETFDNDLAISWLSRSGLKLSTGASYNTGDVKPPLYPTGDTGEYFMGAKLPLLKGFLINEKSIAERQAKIGIPEADANYFTNRLQVLNQSSQSYWDWVASYQKRDAVENVLQLAKIRHEMVRNRVIAGDLPAIDEAEALQEVFRRESMIAKADRDIQKNTFKLSTYLWQQDGNPEPLVTEKQVPTSVDEPKSFPENNWLEGRAKALDERPELKGISLQKEITTLDAKLARNNLLPQLDVFALPGLDTGGFSVGPTAKAGVQFSVPIYLRAARGQLQQANFKLDKLNVMERQLLQQIVLEVDDAYSQIQTSYQQYDAAKNEWTLAQAIEDGERKRFDLGDSTLFLLNQRERMTLEALFKVIDLRAQYLQAVANFKIVTNSL